MKDRLLKFLNKEQLSSARFAEVIGVQPSSISHILSGRNKPGFDFIYKILTNFPSINAEWLITGKGTMLKDDNRQGNLFADEFAASNKTDSDKNRVNTGYDMPEEEEQVKKERSDTNVNLGASNLDYKRNPDSESTVTDVTGGRIVEKIVVFYTNKSFDEYSPA